MGKASSSKKVARAARAGGSLRERPKLGFPLALVAIVLLGTALVVFSRSDRLESLSGKEAPVKNKDHWHAAYGFYICDSFLPPLVDVPGKADTDGIHTHGDGVMHIHPFTSKASGKGAQLSVWGEMVGVKFGKDSIEVNGTKYTNGYKCGDKEAKVLVYRWSNAFDSTVPAEVFDRDFGDIRFKDDTSAFTFAVVPEGTDVPRPESVPQLNSLEDVPGSGAQPGAGAGSGNPLEGIDPSQLSIPPGAGAEGGVVPGVPSVGDPALSTPAPSTPAP